MPPKLIQCSLDCPNPALWRDRNPQMEFRGGRGDTQVKAFGVAREALMGAGQGGHGWI